MKKAIALLLLAGCRSTKAQPAPTAEVDAGPPTKMQVVVLDASPADSADAAPSARYDAGDGEIRDFALETFGQDQDAGPDDPKIIEGTKKYDIYANGRFHFTVDVPTTFVAMEEPTNGDGRVWRVGKLALIGASGMYAADPYAPLPCANSKNVTTFRKGKDFCWSTGKKDGFVFWEKYVRRNGTDFSLRFQYAESAKDAMDPIVKHVSASWSP